MNMVGMNTAAGGPVGGSMVMMNNTGVGTPSNNFSQDSMKLRLNTYIYEYFLKLGHFELARTLRDDNKFDIRTEDIIKQSPGRRKDGEMNGDTMDMDAKDDIPNDLPRPMLQTDSPGNGFLFDWFCLFHDMFNAQRQKPNQQESSVARQYINQTTSLQRMRESQQNSKLPGNGLMGGNPGQIAAMRNLRNNMINGDIQRAAMAKNMTPQQMQQFQAQKMMQQQQQQQQQMQREHSDMGMNGQRPGTPAEGENGGSPSKRPRLGDQQFNGGMVPNGRGQGMPNVNQGMLMQSGFNPNNINQAQFRQNGALQQKALQGQMANGLNMMANTGSPMIPPMDQQFMNGMTADGLGGYRMPAPGMQGGPAAQSGNHALQDYQMQLMLLEQQNKKRLMMARQEQDNITRADGGPPLPGQVGMQPPGMSPSGSRTGTSPIPAEQMKRGTPQLGGPGSPSAGDLQGRGSPLNFMGGMPPDFNPAMLMGKEGIMPGGPGMRQPNMDINALRAQQMRPGQFPPGQPMVPNLSQGQPQPMGTPGQRNNEMPPPQAPATGGSAQRAQPASPQPNAPPTPSQTSKANPKGKKGKDGENTRKRSNKKTSTTNAATSETEPPATPTPSTPITPVHPNSFNTSGGKGPGVPSANAAPTSNPAAQLSQQQSLSQPDLQANGFNDFGEQGQAFNLDFSTLENPDVLENFDFDSFLNQNGEDGFGFDTGLGGEDSFGIDPTVQ